MALWRWAAGQGDQVRLAPVVQLTLACRRSRRALSNPSSVKCCLIRYTVPSATSRASATWGAAQPSDSVAYGLAAIRRAGTVVEAREAFECPCANPLHHSAKPQYVHPSAGPDAWPQLLCSAYGIAEVAALRLRSYDRDMKDPETRLPKSFITEYNRHLSAMEGGF